ncbi:MAG: hypothetical protein HGA74_19740 [Deltaproteobacteria bacterium]|nr:hypothetical protein [Deltaproteobacteria bacterium]
MTKPLRIEILPEEIIAAVKRMKKKEREAFLEVCYRTHFESASQAMVFFVEQAKAHKVRDIP